VEVICPMVGQRGDKYTPGDVIPPVEEAHRQRTHFSAGPTGLHGEYSMSHGGTTNTPKLTRFSRLACSRPNRPDTRPVRLVLTAAIKPVPAGRSRPRHVRR